LTAAADQQPTFVHGRAVFDPVRGAFEPGVGLLVEAGRIVAVGTAGNVRPAGTATVDLGDAVLVPGFVDAHDHITIGPGEGGQHEQLQAAPAWQAVRGVDNLRRMLASGVTTARIMAEEHDVDFEFKAAVERGEVIGPRLRVPGRGLSPPGKHGSAVAGVSGGAELRAAVRRNAEMGADHIKIFTTGGVSLSDSDYSGEEIAEIVAEAAAAGLTVAAHAHGVPGVDLAVGNGVRSIEHGALLTEQDVRGIAEADAWLVLTNTILFHPAGIEGGDAREPAILAKVREARAAMERTAELVRAAGIKVALGTDSMHGLFGHELQWLVEHGWSPAEALTAATLHGALVAGADDAGTLAPGRRADFVALGRNPIDDITAVHDVRAVFSAGHQVVDARGYCRPRPAAADGDRP
jgi:imidazolonepropionase-like amidohydrolase